MEPFQELGLSIKRRWLEKNLAPEAFPELTREGLEEFGLHERLEPADLLRFALLTESLPHQIDLNATFGQPPLTLYADDVLSISALFWLDGTTRIHQHSFSGAFTVLSGSSIHSCYVEVTLPIRRDLSRSSSVWIKCPLKKICLPMPSFISPPSPVSLPPSPLN